LSNGEYEVLAAILDASGDREATLKVLHTGGAKLILAAINAVRVKEDE